MEAKNFTLFAILIVVLSSFVFVQSVQSQLDSVADDSSARKLIEEAIVLILDGRYRPAEMRLQQVIDMTQIPSYKSEAYYWFAVSKYKQKDIEEAIRKVGKAIETDPTAYPPRVLQKKLQGEALFGILSNIDTNIQSITQAFNRKYGRGDSWWENFWSWINHPITNLFKDDEVVVNYENTKFILRTDKAGILLLMKYTVDKQTPYSVQEVLANVEILLDASEGERIVIDESNKQRIDKLLSSLNSKFVHDSMRITGSNSTVELYGKLVLIDSVRYQPDIIFLSQNGFDSNGARSLKYLTGENYINLAENEMFLTGRVFTDTEILDLIVFAATAFLTSEVQVGRPVLWAAETKVGQLIRLNSLAKFLEVGPTSTASALLGLDKIRNGIAASRLGVTLTQLSPIEKGIIGFLGDMGLFVGAYGIDYTVSKAGGFNPHLSEILIFAYGAKPLFKFSNLGVVKVQQKVLDHLQRLNRAYIVDDVVREAFNTYLARGMENVGNDKMLAELIETAGKTAGVNSDIIKTLKDSSWELFTLARVAVARASAVSMENALARTVMADERISYLEAINGWRRRAPVTATHQVYYPIPDALVTKVYKEGGLTPAIDKEASSSLVRPFKQPVERVFSMNQDQLPPALRGRTVNDFILGATLNQHIPDNGVLVALDINPSQTFIVAVEPGNTVSGSKNIMTLQTFLSSYRRNGNLWEYQGDLLTITAGGEVVEPNFPEIVENPVLLIEGSLPNNRISINYERIYSSRKVNNILSETGTPSIEVALETLKRQSLEVVSKDLKLPPQLYLEYQAQQKEFTNAILDRFSLRDAPEFIRNNLKSFQKARLTQTLDIDQTGIRAIGASGRVEGIEGEYFIKIYRTPRGSFEPEIDLFEQLRMRRAGNVPPPTDHDWEILWTQIQDEVEKGKVAEQLGLGPKVIGIVDVGGNPAIAMEMVKGRNYNFLQRENPDLFNELVTERTRQQIIEGIIKFWENGYIVRDLQPFVLTENQVINGKFYERGDAIFVDFQGMQQVGTNRWLREGDIPSQIIMANEVNAQIAKFASDLRPLAPNMLQTDLVLQRDVIQDVLSQAQRVGETEIANRYAKYAQANSEARDALASGQDIETALQSAPKIPMYYHATSLENAQRILKEQKINEKYPSTGIGGVYFSTKPEEDYGDIVFVFSSNLQAMETISLYSAPSVLLKSGALPSELSSKLYNWVRLYNLPEKAVPLEDNLVQILYKTDEQKAALVAAGVPEEQLVPFSIGEKESEMVVNAIKAHSTDYALASGLYIPPHLNIRPLDSRLLESMAGGIEGSLIPIMEALEDGEIIGIGPPILYKQLDVIPEIKTDIGIITVEGDKKFFNYIGDNMEPAKREFTINDLDRVYPTDRKVTARILERFKRGEMRLTEVLLSAPEKLTKLELGKPLRDGLSRHVPQRLNPSNVEKSLTSEFLDIFYPGLDPSVVGPYLPERRTTPLKAEAIPEQQFLDESLPKLFGPDNPLMDFGGSMYALYESPDGLYRFSRYFLEHSEEAINLLHYLRSENMRTKIEKRVSDITGGKIKSLTGIHLALERVLRTQVVLPTQVGPHSLEDLNALEKQALNKMANGQIAHGTSDPNNLLSIIVSGKIQVIRRPTTEALNVPYPGQAGLQNSYNYGPYYVEVTPESGLDANLLGKSIYANSHLYYIVPNQEVKAAIYAGLDNALSQGIIKDRADMTAEQYVKWAKSRIVTYEERAALFESEPSGPPQRVPLQKGPKSSRPKIYIENGPKISPKIYAHTNGLSVTPWLIESRKLNAPTQGFLSIRIAPDGSVIIPRSDVIFPERILKWQVNALTLPQQILESTLEEKVLFVKSFIRKDFILDYNPGFPYTFLEDDVSELDAIERQILEEYIDDLLNHIINKNLWNLFEPTEAMIENRIAGFLEPSYLEELLNSDEMSLILEQLEQSGIKLSELPEYAKASIILESASELLNERLKRGYYQAQIAGFNFILKPEYLAALIADAASRGEQLIPVFYHPELKDNSGKIIQASIRDTPYSMEREIAKNYYKHTIEGKETSIYVIVSPLEGEELGSQISYIVDHGDTLYVVKVTENPTTLERTRQLDIYSVDDDGNIELQQTIELGSIQATPRRRFFYSETGLAYDRLLQTISGLGVAGFGTGAFGLFCGDGETQHEYGEICDGEEGCSNTCTIRVPAEDAEVSNIIKMIDTWPVTVIQSEGSPPYTQEDHQIIQIKRLIEFRHVRAAMEKLVEIALDKDDRYDDKVTLFAQQALLQVLPDEAIESLRYEWQKLQYQKSFIKLPSPENPLKLITVEEFFRRKGIPLEKEKVEPPRKVSFKCPVGQEPVYDEYDPIIPPGVEANFSCLKLGNSIGFNWPSDWPETFLKKSLIKDVSTSKKCIYYFDTSDSIYYTQEPARSVYVLNLQPMLGVYLYDNYNYNYSDSAYKVQQRDDYWKYISGHIKDNGCYVIPKKVKHSLGWSVMDPSDDYYETTFRIECNAAVGDCYISSYAARDYQILGSSSIVTKTKEEGEALADEYISIVKNSFASAVNNAELRNFCSLRLCPGKTTYNIDFDGGSLELYSVLTDDSDKEYWGYKILYGDKMLEVPAEKAVEIDGSLYIDHKKIPDIEYEYFEGLRRIALLIKKGNIDQALSNFNRLSNFDLVHAASIGKNFWGKRAEGFWGRTIEEDLENIISIILLQKAESGDKTKIYEKVIKLAESAANYNNFRWQDLEKPDVSEAARKYGLDVTVETGESDYLDTEPTFVNLQKDMASVLAKTLLKRPDMIGKTQYSSPVLEKFSLVGASVDEARKFVDTMTVLTLLENLEMYDEGIAFLEGSIDRSSSESGDSEGSAIIYINSEGSFGNVVSKINEIKAFHSKTFRIRKPNIGWTGGIGFERQLVEFVPGLESVAMNWDGMILLEKYVEKKYSSLSESDRASLIKLFREMEGLAKDVGLENIMVDSLILMFDGESNDDIKATILKDMAQYHDSLLAFNKIREVFENKDGTYSKELENSASDAFVIMNHPGSRQVIIDKGWENENAALEDVPLRLVREDEGQYFVSSLKRSDFQLPDYILPSGQLNFFDINVFSDALSSITGAIVGVSEQSQTNMYLPLTSGNIDKIFAKLVTHNKTIPIIFEETGNDTLQFTYKGEPIQIEGKHGDRVYLQIGDTVEEIEISDPTVLGGFIDPWLLDTITTVQSVGSNVLSGITENVNIELHKTATMPERKVVSLDSHGKKEESLGGLYVSSIKYNVCSVGNLVDDFIELRFYRNDTIVASTHIENLGHRTEKNCPDMGFKTVNTFADKVSIVYSGRSDFYIQNKAKLIFYTHQVESPSLGVDVFNLNIVNGNITSAFFGQSDNPTLKIITTENKIKTFQNVSPDNIVTAVTSAIDNGEIQLIGEEDAVSTVKSIVATAGMKVIGFVWSLINPSAFDISAGETKEVPFRDKIVTLKAVEYKGQVVRFVIYQDKAIVVDTSGEPVLDTSGNEQCVSGWETFPSPTSSIVACDAIVEPTISPTDKPFDAGSNISADLPVMEFSADFSRSENVEFGKFVNITKIKFSCLSKRTVDFKIDFTTFVPKIVENLNCKENVSKEIVFGEITTGINVEIIGRGHVKVFYKEAEEPPVIVPVPLPPIETSDGSFIPEYSPEYNVGCTNWADDIHVCNTEPDRKERYSFYRLYNHKPNNIDSDYLAEFAAPPHFELTGAYIMVFSKQSNSWRELPMRIGRSEGIQKIDEGYYVINKGSVIEEKVENLDIDPSKGYYFVFQGKLTGYQGDVANLNGLFKEICVGFNGLEYACEERYAQDHYPYVRDATIQWRSEKIDNTNLVGNIKLNKGNDPITYNGDEYQLTYVSSPGWARIKINGEDKLFFIGESQRVGDKIITVVDLFQYAPYYPDRFDYAEVYVEESSTSSTNADTISDSVSLGTEKTNIQLQTSISIRGGLQVAQKEFSANLPGLTNTRHEIVFSSTSPEGYENVYDGTQNVPLNFFIKGETGVLGLYFETNNRIMFGSDGKYTYPIKYTKNKEYTIRIDIDNNGEATLYVDGSEISSRGNYKPNFKDVTNVENIIFSATGRPSNGPYTTTIKSYKVTKIEESTKTGIDLSIISLNSQKNQFSPGEEIFVDMTVKNQGSLDSQNSLTRFYLVNSDGLEYLLGAAIYPAVKSEQVSLMTKKLLIPTFMPKGSYILKVVIDPKKESKDTDFSNNEKTIGGIQII